MLRGTIQIGSEFTLSNKYYISKDQRYRGMAALFDYNKNYIEDTGYWNYKENGHSLVPWAVISTRELRKALDAITLDDVPEVYVRLRYYTGVGHHLVRENHFQNYFDWNGVDQEYGKLTKGCNLRLRLGNGGSKVRITAPCGETRVYRLSTLDRALSELGA